MLFPRQSGNRRDSPSKRRQWPDYSGRLQRKAIRTIFRYRFAKRHLLSRDPDVY